LTPFPPEISAERLLLIHGGAVLSSDDGPAKPHSEYGYMQASHYQLSWSLPCTFEHVKTRLPVLLDYMSSNGCEWIFKLSPRDRSNSYVEVLVTCEGSFWPVFIFDHEMADEKRLNLDQRELTLVLGWEWPDVPVPENMNWRGDAFSISSAISCTVLQSLERVFDSDLGDVLDLTLFQVRGG
jgi:hypothetical protein